MSPYKHRYMHAQTYTLGFRKLRVPYFGVRMIRILLFRVLYEGLGNSHSHTDRYRQIEIQDNQSEGLDWGPLAALALCVRVAFIAFLYR